MDDGQLEGWRVMLERNVCFLLIPALLLAFSQTGLLLFHCFRALDHALIGSRIKMRSLVVIK